MQDEGLPAMGDAGPSAAEGGEKPSKGKAGLHKALGTADKVLLSSAAGQRAERRVEGEG